MHCGNLFFYQQRYQQTGRNRRYFPDTLGFVPAIALNRFSASAFTCRGRDTARCGQQPDASESEGDLAPFVPDLFHHAYHPI